ncbi:hypothetical protein [uncultured Mailhella sp.]|uniref:hypothetical protein n=1 Tax=uncultured Mailhella sp. TaxID=1981031 RepID=UPI0025EE6800|nr:hypothetical protein [uncultured Mailhella sp.]
MVDGCRKRRRSLELSDARKQHSFAERRKPVPFLSNSCLNLPIAVEAEKRAEGEGAFGAKGERRGKIRGQARFSRRCGRRKPGKTGAEKDGKYGGMFGKREENAPDAKKNQIYFYL